MAGRKLERIVAPSVAARDADVRDEVKKVHNIRKVGGIKVVAYGVVVGIAGRARGAGGAVASAAGLTDTVDKEFQAILARPWIGWYTRPLPVGAAGAAVEGRFIGVPLVT